MNTCFKCKTKTEQGTHQTVSFDYEGDEEYQEFFCKECGPELPEPNYKDINFELQLASQE